MTLDTVKIKHGYKIRGIEPPDLGSYDASTRKMYWQWVVELGLKRKDRELAQGLDKDGKPLRPITEYTRKHRRSMMTPSGKGDPGAPPLTPGLQKSRTRSLLAGRALSTHADFYWRFDGFTGDSWAVVLSYQADRGRDVFGISKAGLANIKAKSWAMWSTWKEGSIRKSTPATESEPEAETESKPTKFRRQPGESKVVNEGRKPSPAATYGVGTSEPRKGHGGRTPAEWEAYFRQTAAANPPGRPAAPKSKSPLVGPRHNRIVRSVWTNGKRPAAAGQTAAKPGRPSPELPTSPRSVAPTPPRDFAADVLTAAANVPASKLFGDNKAWIHDVWAEYVKLPGSLGLSLDAFKALIVEELAIRMRMARADLVQAMNPADVEASDTHYRSGTRILATFNFIKVARS